MKTGLSTVRSPLAVAALLLSVGALALGCKPKIGEDCSTSIDCSQTGDRLCDTSQPGGYCTIFNCEPGACPSDEAVCVGFYPSVCGDPRQEPRFERTFCMAICSDQGDCRAGYRCADLTSDPSARIVDSNPVSRRVCLAAASLPESDAGTSDAYCGPTDASFPPIDAGTPPDAEADAEVDATRVPLPDGG